MKIEKLKSGSYRIRKMYKGVTYTVVTEYKPTQKEAMQLMAEELNKTEPVCVRMTFETAAYKYIEQKRKEKLSPTTLKEYHQILENRISSHFKKLLLNDISQKDIDKEIALYSPGKKPKTIRNFHSFISSVLKANNKNLVISTALPKKEKALPYIPTSDVVKEVLELAKNTEYEIPLILACYGMRRSEICALTVDDIKGDVVRINKAMVIDEENNWVIKTTKTASSTREIIIPMDVADLIRGKGYIYKGHPNNITRYLKRTLQRLGYESFSLHKLRHYFASALSDMNTPEADIMRLGGWETDHVMKTVYRHSMATKEKEREIASQLGNKIFS